jgi:release factor glutamine methyltransferase
MSVNIKTIKDIRNFLSEEIGEIYKDPEKNSVINLIIMTLFGFSKLHQVYLSDQLVPGDQAEKIIEICKELKTGRPVQYVLGETIFYDCKIKVSESVLIPRPETEELVQLVISENRGLHCDIIDFGTGSGCIAIALAANLKGANVTGIDISEAALEVARENAEINSVNVIFKKGNILNFRTESVNKPFIIVSNPPYVRNSEKKIMHKNVLDFEPHQALFADDSDPLAYYRAILEIADVILLPGGRIYFEINEAMGEQMKALMDSFKYPFSSIIKDLSGKDRFIKGTKNG